MPKDKGIELGKLQAKFEADAKAYHAAEKALARAQELRDGAKARLAESDAALRQAARAVLG